jgi:hypothetical protein
MRVGEFVERADQLIAQAEAALEKPFGRIGEYVVNAGGFNGVRSAALSFLRGVFGAEHPYYTELHKFRYNSLENGQAIREILKAAREEMAGGWDVTVRGLITAEVFADFLEMARHLLDEGYKDPAAVMIGSVLEEHLRQLCVRHRVATEFTNPKGDTVPKKADVLNADLSKAGVYNRLDQKQVTTLLDLRNKAAHGHYGEYTQQQAELMYQQAVDFMARNPAT